MTELEFALGTWEGVSRTSDGRRYRVRMESSWWLDRTTILGESFDAFGDEEWDPFYKGFQAWHGGEERIVFNSVGRDGEFVSGHIEVDPGPVLAWHWTVTGASGATRVGRDTWTFGEGGDSFLWTFATRQEDGSYEPYFEIRMHRVGDAGPGETGRPGLGSRR